MNVDDAFHGISTLVVVRASTVQSQGTGFFYHELGSPDPSKPQWSPIEKTWLVTNRHVLIPRIGGQETVPDYISFHLRKVSGTGLAWEPITILQDELLRRAKFHPDVNVDVCIIDVLDLLRERISTDDKFLQWYSIGKESLPGGDNESVEVADDAVVIGYPRGFYDQTNLFPIVKSGIVASRWGAPFGGLPYFLIDAKLFPGSSGSIVVSKPKEMAMIGGRLMHSREKQFVFLGIFSGEPIRQHQPIEFDDITIIRKSGFNVGTVWYGYLVEEIINNGAPYNTPESTQH